MQINWKIRFKKKTFLLALFSSILMFANQIAALFNYDISSYSQQAETLFNSVLGFLVLLGVVDDPTVKGFGDSDTSMRKEDPSEQDNLKAYLGKEMYVNGKKR